MGLAYFNLRKPRRHNLKKPKITETVANQKINYTEKSKEKKTRSEIFFETKKKKYLKRLLDWTGISGRKVIYVRKKNLKKKNKKTHRAAGFVENDKMPSII